MPELRYNPLLDTHVVLAPQRARRPSELRVSSQIRQDLPCPFCTGNEDATGPTLWQTPHHGPWSARVVANLFPALRVEESPVRRAHGPWGAGGGTGAHEVVIETAHHGSDPELLTPAHVGFALAAWRRRTADLAGDTRLRHITVFRNHGALAGATLDHPHSQLLATPHVPRLIRTLEAQAQRWHALHGRALLADLMDHACASEALLLAELDEAVAFCPWASEFPFEVWITTRRHAARVADWTDAVLHDVARLLHAVQVAHARVLNRPAYNLTLLQAPLREPLRPDGVHAFLRITPILHLPGGFEAGAGERINPTRPEDAAAALGPVVRDTLERMP